MPELPTDTDMTRRQFFLISFSTLAGLFLAACALPPPDPSPHRRIDPPRPPEGAPDDILNAEELARCRIEINHSPVTKLFLRQSIFDHALFSDAREGKIGGAVITLVEAESLSWDAIAGLPESAAEARLVFQACTKHPAEYTSEESAEYLEDLKSPVEHYLRQVAFWQDVIDKVTREIAALDTERRELLDFQLHPTASPHSEEALTQLIAENERNKNKNVEILKQNLLHLEENKRYLADAESEVVAYERDPVAYMAAHSRTLGLFIDTRLFKNVLWSGSDVQGLNERTQLAQNSGVSFDKVHIYIVVGGKYKPSPEQSYPVPDQFEVGHGNGTDYDVFRKGGDSAGFILGHEIAHYNPAGLQARNEHDADHGALNDVVDDATRLATGDNTGYSLVFVNDNGITVTRNTRETMPKRSVSNSTPLRVNMS